MRLRAVFGRGMDAALFAVVLGFSVLLLAPRANAGQIVFGTNGPLTYGYQGDSGSLYNSFPGGGSGMVVGSDGVLYQSGGGGIEAYDPLSGTLLRSFNANLSNSTDLAYGNGLVFGTNGGVIYAYNAVSGSLYRSFLGGGSGLAYGSNGLLYVSGGGNIQAYNPLTGTLVHTFNANFSNDTDIAFGIGRIFGSNGGTIYGYDAVTGDLVSSFAGGGSGLSFGGDGLLYMSARGFVSAVDPRSGAVIHAFTPNFATETDIAVFTVPSPGTLSLAIVSIFMLSVRRFTRSNDIHEQK